MQIYHNLEDIPAKFGPSIVTVGNFDGVHRAHARVLDEITLRAKQRQTSAVAVTFEPHPMRILRPNAPLKLLTPAPEKLRLLEQTGIDVALVLPFSRDLSLLSPHQFVNQILCEMLQAI